MIKTIYNSFFLPRLRQKGVALLMVMASVAVLILILAEFTVDTHINRLRTSNYYEKMQSRLNAEAGLKLAMARLQLYKEAINLLEKNPKQKKQIKKEMLSQIYSIPFIYPIPILEDMNAIQKETITEFMDMVILEGEMSVNIVESSNDLNLNLLRIHSVSNFKEEKEEDDNKDKNPDQQEEEDDQANLDDKEDNPALKIEQKLEELLALALERKKDEDDYFREKYDDIEASYLVKILKYYVNPKGVLEEGDPEISDIANEFDLADRTAKHAPITSLEELYTLPIWTSELVDLIKESVTVHGSMSIDLNTAGKQTLQLLVPEMTDDQVKEFIEYRDDEESPKTFDSLEDFKKYIVDNGIADEQEFDERMAEFKAAGFQFGARATLFKILSNGKLGRSEYTLSAWVTLPVKPPPPPKKENTNKKEDEKKDSDDKDDTSKDDTNKSDSNKKKKKKKRVIQYLEPRIVELLAD